MAQQTATSQMAPWLPQQDHIKYGWGAAKNLFDVGMPGYYPGATVSGFDPTQTAAQQQSLQYLMGPRTSGMQAGAEGQLAGTYGLANRLGAMGPQWGLQGAQAIEPSANQAMQYGQSLSGPMSQSGYGGLTPFDQGQYSDLLAGTLKTGAGTPYQAMTDALTQGVQKNLGENILPGIRSGMMRSGQMGGGSRGDLVQNRAISDAVTQGLTQPLAQMYGQAYNQAQGMRMPAAQMGIGQQQYGMGYGMQGGGLRLSGGQLAQQGLGTGVSAGQLGLSALGRYPSVMNAPLSTYGAINAVGGARRNMTQALIDADRGRYEYESMSPYQNLDRYQGATSGSWGGQGSASYPKQSKWPSIIGGILGVGMNKLF